MVVYLDYQPTTTHPTHYVTVTYLALLHSSCENLHEPCENFHEEMNESTREGRG